MNVLAPLVCTEMTVSRTELTATSVCAVRDLKVSTVKEVCSMIFLRSKKLSY